MEMSIENGRVRQ